MISDTLHDAIHRIEDYQREFPESYSDITDHIKVVKKVMASLMNRLDEAPVEYHPHLAETLTPDEQGCWQVTCEANIARWVERLRLLEPVSAEDLVGKLGNAIRRQEEMLEERSNRPDDIRRDLLRRACEQWYETATNVARDALEDLLNDHPDEAESLVGPISCLSEFWTEQIVRAALGLASDDSDPERGEHPANDGVDWRDCGF